MKECFPNLGKDTNTPHTHTHKGQESQVKCNSMSSMPRHLNMKVSRVKKPKKKKNTQGFERREAG